jgi:hypothetical protein
MYTLKWRIYLGIPRIGKIGYTGIAKLTPGMERKLR